MTHRFGVHPHAIQRVLANNCDEIECGKNTLIRAVLYSRHREEQAVQEAALKELAIWLIGVAWGETSLAVSDAIYEISAALQHDLRQAGAVEDQDDHL